MNGDDDHERQDWSDWEVDDSLLAISPDIDVRVKSDQASGSLPSETRVLVFEPVPQIGESVLSTHPDSSNNRAGSPAYHLCSLDVLKANPSTSRDLPYIVTSFTLP
jgi:hypothetical protein